MIKDVFLTIKDNPSRLLEGSRSFVNTHKAANREYDILLTEDSYSMTYESFDFFKETRRVSLSVIETHLPQL